LGGVVVAPLGWGGRLFRCTDITLLIRFPSAVVAVARDICLAHLECGSIWTHGRDCEVA